MPGGRKSQPNWLLLLSLVTLAGQASAHFEESPEIRSYRFGESDFLRTGLTVQATLLYTPDNSECLAFFKSWQQLARSLRGFVQFSATDITNIRFSGEKKTGPYVQLHFGERSEKAVQYTGVMGVKELFGFIKDQVNRLMQIQLAEETDEPLIATLSDKNFDQRINHSQFPWVVKFFTNWCGLCKSMKVPWEEAAKKLSRKYAFGEVDCELHAGFCQDLGITGYPSVFIFPPNSGDDTVGTAYEGSRENVEDIVNTLEKKYKENRYSEPTVAQIIDPETFEANCMNNHGCVIFFLPMFHNEQGEGKHLVYLRNLNALMAEMSKFNYRFLWTFLTDQTDFETTFPINSQHVAVLAIHAKSRTCAGLKGEGKFSYRTLREFVSDALQHRTKQFSLPKLMPLVQYIDPWTIGKYPLMEVEVEEGQEDPSAPRVDL